MFPQFHKKMAKKIDQSATPKSPKTAPSCASIKQVFSLSSALSTIGGYWPYSWEADGSAISFKLTSFRSIASISAVLLSLYSIAVMVIKGEMMTRIFDFYVGYQGKQNPAELFGFVVSTWNGVAHDLLLLALNLAWSRKIVGCWNNTLKFWDEATSKMEKPPKLEKMIQEFKRNSRVISVTIFALVVWAAAMNTRPLVTGFFQVFELDFAVGMTLAIGYWNFHSLVHSTYYTFVGLWIYWLGYCYNVVEELIPLPEDGAVASDAGVELGEVIKINCEDYKEAVVRSSSEAIQDVIQKTLKLDQVFEDFVDCFKVHLVACLSALGVPLLFALFFTFTLDTRFQGEDDSFAIVTKAGMAAGFLSNGLTLVFLCCSATYVVIQRNRIPERLSTYAIQNDIEDEKVKEQLQFFLHRMQAKSLSVSPFDFVTFGNQLLASICAGVATYMVVLYQFNASNTK